MREIIECEERDNRTDEDRVRDIIHAIASYQRGQGESAVVSVGATPWSSSEETPDIAARVQPNGEPSLTETTSDIVI